MYSTKLLNHFEHPRNAGKLEAPDAHARVENPACGDVLELNLKIAGGRISEVRFRAKGCVPAMACASAVTELLVGCTRDEAMKITRRQVIEAVDGVPTASGHAADLAIDAIKFALR